MRSEGWSPNPEVEEKFQNAYKNKKLRSALNRVKKKMATDTNERENNHIRIAAATTRSIPLPRNGHFPS